MTLKLYPNIGDSIKECLEKAKAISILTGLWVEFSGNDVTIVVKGEEYIALDGKGRDVKDILGIK